MDMNVIIINIIGSLTNVLKSKQSFVASDSCQLSPSRNILIGVFFYNVIDKSENNFPNVIKKMISFVKKYEG